MSEKGLVSKQNKTFLKFNNNKTSNPKKWAISINSPNKVYR